MDFRPIALSLFAFLAFAALADAVSCGDTLSTLGATYELTGNLSNTVTCLTVAANNVVIDCKGYWINGGSTGVLADGVNGTIVRGCGFYNFTQVGVDIENTASNVTVFNNTIDGYGRGGYGIGIGWGGEEYGANNVIRLNSIRNVSWGLYILTSDNVTIDSNSFDYCSDYGIQSETSSQNMNGSITSNNFSNNQGNDIDLGGTYNYNISGNKMTNSVVAVYTQGYYGVEYANFTISYNTITNTSDQAIYVNDCSGNDISFNTIANTGKRAIQVEGGSNNNITSNTITNASSNGIWVYPGDYNRIVSNNINRVMTGTVNIAGICLIQSAHNLVSYNSVNNSKSGILSDFSSTYSNFTSNSINNITFEGMSISGQHCRIESNRIYNTTDYAIYVDASDANVLSNSIELSDIGIGFDAPSSGSCSFNNITEVNTSGIDTSQGYNLLVASNNISSSNYGIYCPSPYNISFTDNYFNTPNYSIYLLASDSSNVAIDNIQTGSGPDLYSSTAMNWTYARSAGKIAFTNVKVNTSTVGNMFVGTGVAAVNATALPTLNKTARITMTVSGYCSAPGGVTLYYAPSYYTTLNDIIGNGQLCNAGTIPSCTQVSCSGSTVVFDVQHFDSYGGQGGDVPEFSVLTAIAAVLLAAGGYALARKRR